MINTLGEVPPTTTKSLIGAAALVVSTSTAFAGNIVEPVIDPPIIATVQGPHDFSGAFVGGMVSYQSGDADWTFTAGGLTTSPSISGAMAGLYGGYNWQNNHLVFGIDALYMGGSVEGTAACPNAAFNCITKIEQVGAVRGRVGHASQNMLVYIAGGFATAQINNRDPLIATGVDFDNQTDSYNGWTAAIGVEGPINNSGWYARGEVNYYDFGEVTTLPNDPATISVNTMGVSVGVHKKF